MVTQALLFSLAAYPLVLSGRPLAHRWFEFMGVSAGQIGPQKVYFDILLYAVILSLTRNCLSGFFSGIGRTRIVMAASLTAMTVNVLLNYVLIFGKFGLPAMGIRGAAYGTILGGAAGLAMLAAKYFSPAIRTEYRVAESFRFDGHVAGKLLRFGYPSGLEFFLNLLAFNALVLTFHAHDPATATAATIVFNWDMVSFVPLVGVEIGVTSLVGRFMGAGEPETAHRSVMSGLKMGLVYSTVILILFVGFPEELVAVFRPGVPDPTYLRAVPTAVFMVRMASLYVLVEAMIVVFFGALRGAGDTFWAMAMSVSMHWLMVLLLSVGLRALGWSPETAWSVIVFGFLLFSYFVYRRYHGGQWKNIRVVQPEPALPAADVFHEPADL
ncbi:MAG TPA: MATE family efflux transporter [Elusimicrobiota bacterium]|nr:MATE family efflux transporter [Elusimicrobiota bacterium]